MKTFRSRLTALFAVLILGCALAGCGGVELKPEQQALVDKYERLIDTYESKFEAAQEDPSQFAKVTDSYTKELELLVQEFKTMAPSLSDSEGLAMKARFDKLNRRSEKISMGG